MTIAWSGRADLRVRRDVDGVMILVWGRMVMVRDGDVVVADADAEAEADVK